MNRNLKNIVVAAILLVAMVAIVVYILNTRTEAPSTDCSPPTVPQSVPADAYWAGGCAGGNWIYMVQDDSSKYHFQVFNGGLGKLQIDARFAPDSVATVDINLNNWKDLKLYYQEGLDSLVYIVVASPTDTMTLRSTYPAFGGEIWENIRRVHDDIPQSTEK